MTSAFSREDSVSLCPASFCMPRPDLPVTPGILLTFYFCILIPYDEKDIFFSSVSSRRSCMSSFNFIQLQCMNHSTSAFSALVVGA